MPIANEALRTRTPFTLFGDGTVAAPSIAFVNDSDTGFYRQASGVIGVVSNAAEILRISGTAGTTTLDKPTASATIAFAINGTNRLTLDDGSGSATNLSLIPTTTNTSVLSGRSTDGDFVIRANSTDTTLRLSASTLISLENIAGTDRITLAVTTGRTTFAGAAVSGGSGLIVLTPGAHTAVTAEAIDVSQDAHTITITGAYATQRFWNIAQPTISAASALAVTTAVTVNIDGAPTQASSAQISSPVILRIGSSGAVTFQGVAASAYAGFQLSAHTITDATTTQVTAAIGVAGISVGVITVNQSGGAVTIDQGASVYIAGALTAGGSVTISNNYALFVDAGSIRFDSSLFVEATPTEGAAGEQLTSGGAGAVMTWDAAGCVREAKEQIEAWGDPHAALAAILSTPIYRFHYRAPEDRSTAPGLSDRATTYVGPMAEEAPWAMHYGGRILNPINAFGYTVLGFQALHNELEALRLKVSTLERKAA